ncbi:MAG TPA: glycosyltransferase family 39 protein [Polyangia bacterium]|nr:glycosyltransferase family 39 protein [Polyangia bacterium]
MGLFIVALAIGVRVAWVFLVPTRPVGDFAMYIESARYLVEHRGLDPEFIYMPGYVAMVAAVHALGGGLLAIKMIGVVAGGLAAGAVYGLGRLLFGGTAAVVAGLLCALWPGGIAVSSVTGTDMPATALIVIAVWLLVRGAGARPLGAPALYGLVLGLAAYVRAVALPLTLMAAPHFRARGAAFGHVITRTLAAAVVASLVLLPWGIRNKKRYGEFFLTDSHGGHTALVGSNPNSDGTYTRSLNRLFYEGTGYRLFAPPHRESDRAAFKLAVQWVKAEPKYALGLLAIKADRLLSHERPLLYWPLYRQSVLPPESRVFAWFTRHRTGVERVVDGFWYVFIAAVLVGVIAAFARRNRPATSLLPIPFALAAIYALFFAEARYHLPVAVLLMPFAGAGLVWVGEAVRDLARFTIDRQRRPRLLYEGVLAAVAIAVVFVGWPRMLAAGTRLRAEHRWAVAACNIDGAKHICEFRPVVGKGQPSPVRGTWDGFGLRLMPPATTAAATTDLDLAAGKYRVSMRIDCADTCLEDAEIAISTRSGTGAETVEARRMPWPAAGSVVALVAPVTHAGGKLHVEIQITGKNLHPASDVTALWVAAFEVESETR